MTLTKFMARSTWVAHAFEWEKLLKCHLKGKASKKLANGQNIDYSEKRKRPKGFICPCTGVKNHNIQTCLLVYAADSGERLQDHWSSGKARSTWVAYVFEWVDLLKCHLKGKTCRILANGQDIDYPENKIGPRASSVPILKLFSIIFKHVYWTIGPLVSLF